MLLHFTVMVLECAAVAAFLILWYFWAKRKLLCSYVLEDDEHVLFPFRHFSWLLVGIVLVTCLVQIHFVRTSSQLHDRLAALSKEYRDQEQSLRSLQGLESSVDNLRKDVSVLVKEVRTQHVRQLAQIASAATPNLSVPVPGATLDGEMGASASARKARAERESFAAEAKTSSLASAKKATSASAVTDKTDDTSHHSEAFSMRLNRIAEVTVDSLRVRKRPAANAPVMEKLAAGEQVKVTEKRLFKDNMWFRIITPSGRAGWVDFRFIKLGGDA
jgi:hypothetical protein